MFLGRPVRPGDPQWLPTDRELALAWQRNKAQTCAGCGTRADEWDEDREAYISDQHYCPGCAALAGERDNIPEQDGKPVPGYLPFLQPRELYEALHPDDDGD